MASYSEDYQSFYRLAEEKGEDDFLGMGYILYSTEGKSLSDADDTLTAKEYTSFLVCANAKYPHIFLLKARYEALLENAQTSFDVTLDNYLQHEDSLSTFTYAVEESTYEILGSWDPKGESIVPEGVKVTSPNPEKEGAEKVDYLDPAGEEAKAIVGKLEKTLPTLREARKRLYFRRLEKRALPFRRLVPSFLRDFRQSEDGGRFPLQPFLASRLLRRFLCPRHCRGIGGFRLGQMLPKAGQGDRGR